MGYRLPTWTDWVTCSWQCHKNRNPPSSEPGTDYGAGYGSDVYAVDNGRITYTKTSNSQATGRVVEYVLNDGRTTRTLHMSSVNVSVGQSVTRGQLLGKSGASGYGDDWYYGPHVHQTLWPGAAWAAPTIDFALYVGTDDGDDDMPLTDSEIDKIAQRVWQYSMGGGGANDPNAVPTETAGERLRQIRRSTNGLKSRTEDILTAVSGNKIAATVWRYQMSGDGNIPSETGGERLRRIRVNTDPNYEPSKPGEEVLDEEDRDA